MLGFVSFICALGITLLTQTHALAQSEPEAEQFQMLRQEIQKLRDVNAGHTIERSFQSDDRFVRARLDTIQMQYLYAEGELYYFMDQETFEQVPLNKDQVETALPFLKEGDSVEVSKYKDEIISVDVPITVNLEVTQTDPGFKGDTATGGSKPATLETGLTVNVPLFINEGDVIKVDTRTSSYIERAG